MLAILLFTGLVATTASIAAAQGPIIPSGCSHGGAPPGSEDHCVPLPVSLSVKQDISPSGCTEVLVMEVPLEPGITEYDAVWTRAPSTGPWYFSSLLGGPYNPPQAWYRGPTIPIGSSSSPLASGKGAWVISGGGGPHCGVVNEGEAEGWGWTSKASISGSVMTPSGKPIPGARIEISGPSSAHLTTAADGTYGPLSVRPGHYSVNASYLLDKHEFALSSGACTPGSHVGKSCDGACTKTVSSPQTSSSRPSSASASTPRSLQETAEGLPT